MQKPDYAQAIMDEMMSSNKQVQNHPVWTLGSDLRNQRQHQKPLSFKKGPAFCGTQERDDVIVILQNHLESFEAGANITDDIP